MPRPKRPTQEEIGNALKAAGIEDEELARKLSENLAGNRGRIGRPPEKDEKELLAIARLVLKGQNPHAAAKQVTANLPESKRAAARQRLYKKFTKDADSWRSKVPPNPLPTIQEEIERLREVLGPSAGHLDYGLLLRRIHQKEP